VVSLVVGVVSLVGGFVEGGFVDGGLVDGGFVDGGFVGRGAELPVVPGELVPVVPADPPEAPEADVEPVVPPAADAEVLPSVGGRLTVMLMPVSGSVTIVVDVVRPLPPPASTADGLAGSLPGMSPTACACSTAWATSRSNAVPPFESPLWFNQPSPITSTTRAAAMTVGPAPARGAGRTPLLLPVLPPLPAMAT
jgi:hypothetical protein